MAILVTRPDPDNETTARALAVRGHAALLAPMLRFEAVAFQDDGETAYDGVILTSANAVRALTGHPAHDRLAALPAFAVGEHTADVARAAGFKTVASAQGDAASLRDLLLARVASRKLKKSATLCHLAGADLAHDFGADPALRNFNLVKHTAYRMMPVADFPPAIAEAFRAGTIAAVLHYSRRSARAFLNAARAAGVEVTALALPQCCISDAVAAVLREAGAPQVAAAKTPDEAALLAALDRMVKPSPP